MKNKKVFFPVIAVLLSAMLNCSFITGSKSPQLNAVDVYLNGSKLKISTLLDKGTLYVPVDGICHYFKCDYKKDDEKKTINFIRSRSLNKIPEGIDGRYAKKRDIKTENSGYQTTIDGINLFIYPIVYDNVFFIPLELFAESFEKSAEWNLFKNSMKIKDYPQDYVGSLNGEKIKKRVFNERYSTKYTRMESENTENDKNGKQIKKQISKEQKNKLKNEVFDEIVDLMLASQKAPEYGVIMDENIKSGINYYLSMTVKRFGGIEGFRKMFKKNGITYQDAINYFTYGVVKDALMEKIASDVEPPEEMMKAYYDNSPKTFIRPDKAIVRHIIIPINDKDGKSLGNEKIEEQKKLADMISGKIKNGGDFDELRRRYSEDHYPDTKDHAEGFEVTRGLLSIAKVFEDEVFKLNPGEISGVVRTYRGFHIIKMVSKTEEKQKTFEESKEKIKKDLAYTAKTSYLDELMQNWKKESVIEKQL